LYGESPGASPLSLSDYASVLLFILRFVWGLYERARIIRYFLQEITRRITIRMNYTTRRLDGCTAHGHHAFGLIATTFSELDWKTLIVFERAVPIVPNACQVSPLSQSIVADLFDEQSRGPRRGQPGRDAIERAPPWYNHDSLSDYT
jgi:hypothetical protein